MHAALCFVFAIISLASSEIVYTPVVRTVHGRMRGIVQTAHDGRQVNAYLGVRYGRARRFSLPSLAANWRHVYNATHARTACPQPGMEFDPGHIFEAGETESSHTSEDCLFMNIWTPVTRIRAGRGMPVLVFIHGGSFKRNTIFSHVFDGRELASQGEMMVVSIAYRLGPFGFFAGSQWNEKGNQGIADQMMALYYLRSIIPAFGGDRLRVTLMGQSAGSISTGLALLQPLARSMFQRAIMLSGSALGSVMDYAQGRQVAASFAQRVGCDAGEDIDASIDCMRELPVPRLLEAVQHSTSPEVFWPVQHDGLLFPQDSVTTLKNLDARFDLLYGVVRDEGAVFFLNQLNRGNITIDKVRNDIRFLLNQANIAGAEEVVKFYTGKLSARSSPQEINRALVNTFGDMLLACPTLIFGNYLSQYARPLQQRSRHYSYHFNHTNSLLGCDQLVCHGSDVYYVFGVPLRFVNDTAYDYKFTPSDVQLSRTIIKAWSNFVHTGEMGKLDTGLEWPETIDQRRRGGGDRTKPAIRFMEFNGNTTRVGDNLLHDRCEFWRSRILNIKPMNLEDNSIKWPGDV